MLPPFGAVFFVGVGWLGSYYSFAGKQFYWGGYTPPNLGKINTSVRSGHSGIVNRAKDPPRNIFDGAIIWFKIRYKDEYQRLLPRSSTLCRAGIWLKSRGVAKLKVLVAFSLQLWRPPN